MADLGLLKPVIQKLGKRAALHIVEEGNHSFKVPKRTGKTDDDVTNELCDAIDEWTGTLAL